MKKYQRPEIELDALELEDIIMASSGLDNDPSDEDDLDIDLANQSARADILL